MPSTTETASRVACQQPPQQQPEAVAAQDRWHNSSNDTTVIVSQASPPPPRGCGPLLSLANSRPQDVADGPGEPHAACCRIIMQPPPPPPLSPPPHYPPPPLDFSEPLLDAQRRQLETLIQAWSSGNHPRGTSASTSGSISGGSSSSSIRTGKTTATSSLASLSTLDEEQQSTQQCQQQQQQASGGTTACSLSSTASAVLIRGAPGSGKTYLLNAFAAHVQRTRENSILNGSSSSNSSCCETEDAAAQDHVLTGRAIFGPSPAADREPFATIVDLVESLLESLVEWCNRSSNVAGTGKYDTTTTTISRQQSRLQHLRRVTWRDRLLNDLSAQEVLILRASLPYLQVLLDVSDDNDEEEDYVHVQEPSTTSSTTATATTRRQARQKQRRRHSFRRRSSWSVASSIMGGEDGVLDNSCGTGAAGGTAAGGGDDPDEQQDAFVGPTRQGQYHRSLEKEWRLERFQLAIRSLMRCLARHQSILLMLDNMQWASTDSLQILRTLIHDPVLHPHQQHQQQSQQQPGDRNYNKWNQHPHAARLSIRRSSSSNKGKWKRFLLVGAYRNEDQDDAIFWCLQAPPNGGDDDADDDSASRTTAATARGASKKKTCPNGDGKDGGNNKGNNSTGTSATVPSTHSTTGCSPTAVCGPAGSSAGGLQEVSHAKGSTAMTVGGAGGCANVMFLPLSDRLTRQELSHWMCRQLMSSSSSLSTPPCSPSKQTCSSPTSTTSPLTEKQQEEQSPHHLVEMVYTKTGGHPFSVVQVLQRLQSKGCFRYSQSKNRWEWWSDSKITAALKSVPSCSLKKPFVKISRQLIIDKILRMDKCQQMVLLTAAFLSSSTFDADTLVQAMTANENEEWEDDDDETTDSTGDDIVGDLSIQTLLRHDEDLQHSAAGTTATKSRHPHQLHGSSLYGPYYGGSTEMSCSAAADGTKLVLKILGELVKKGKGWLMEEDVFAETASGCGSGGNGSEYDNDDCRRFCFRHELVREAASTMPLHSASSSSSASSNTSSQSRDLDTTARQQVHLRIGRRLNYCLQERHETGVSVDDPMLLNCVLQLNLASACLTDRWEIIDLIELNYQAAEVHALKSSFFVARCFLLKGISLLGETPWVENYDLMKKMSNALTRMQYCCGELDDSLETANKVIANTTSFSEKRIAYHTKILCLHQQKQDKAAVDFIVFLLAELGHPFPKRGLRVHVAQSILRTRRLLRGWSDDQLLNLPTAAPQDHASLGNACELMLFLAQLSSPSSSFFHGTIGVNGFCETSSYATLTLLRLLQTTLSQGRIPITSICFVAWSWLLAQTGDYDGAQRFGRLGMRHATEGNCYDEQAKIMYHSCVAHWRLPYQDCLLSISKSISGFRECGALDLIHDNSIYEVRLAFLCGQPLSELSQATQKLARVLTDYKQRAQYNVHLPFFQMVSNLVDQCEDPTKLTGEYMDEQDKVEAWENSGNETALQTLYLCSATLAFIFNDLSLAGEMCDNLVSPYMDSSDCWIPYRLFLQGMVHFSMARSTGSRKYRRHGDAVIRQFEKWAKEGVLNIRPMLLMLQAEHVCTSSSKKSADVVRTAWDDAIDACVRVGFVHLQAMANELAGTYFRDVPTLEGKNTHYLAVRYLAQAAFLYRQWGCAGKVTQMQTRYSSVLEPCSEALSIQSCSSQSSSFRVSTMERQESGGDRTALLRGRSGNHLRWSNKI